MSPLSTRLATLADLPAVAELFNAYRQFYEQAPDLPLATQFIRTRMQERQSVVLVAERVAERAAEPMAERVASGPAQVLGFCQLYPSFCSVLAQPIYVLYDLFVDPTARKSGAGRALLLAAEDHARQQGMARMDLTTAHTNTQAQSLYATLGWERDQMFMAFNKTVSR
jgi:ribosomal protein S18 acetylase RimI-like enzyme